MKNLYEFLVPTVYGDTMGPIRTRHHKRWDEVVRKITGGLTLMPVAKGQWVHKDEVHEERIIPVRIACDEAEIQKIAQFSLQHYRQKAVMFYLLSKECHIIMNQNLS